MDHRGHPRPDSGSRHSHRRKDRENYYWYSQHERDQGYPPAELREGDRYWAHSDARPRAHYTSPPARLDQYSYSTQQYSYGYVHREHQRPQSRVHMKLGAHLEALPKHADYPAHSHWDYRDYGYYDDDYYRGQYGQQDGQCGPQDSWRTEPYHERTNKQEHTGSSYTEEYRYDQRRGSSQHYLSNYEFNPSREKEELPYSQGTLESSKNSGLSSRSYELSQYINEAEHSEHATQSAHISNAELHPEVSAPLKFSIPHAVVSFGPAGQLIRVTPGLSTQENVSQLEIHSLELILSDTAEQQEMGDFPGPLAREDLHKVDAMEFAHQRAVACKKADKLHDKRSAALLWNLLILLCRQNGQIVGSDIAELLMQGSNSDGSWQSEAPTLIDFSEGSTAEAPPCSGDDLLTGEWSSFSSKSSVKALQSYTKLLLAGRKKEALESAMSSGLWGHALFLASKMDNRSYTTVLSRFTGQLMATDPLQTLFQLLSGRVPAVAMCCGDKKWGDWRPHLAVMLSNEAGDPAVQQKAIVTMGDTLASRGLLHAAHVCYLTASVPFGVFTQKTDRLVLLGSSHRQSFGHFATNLAIQCTELYEYCQTLGGKYFPIPSFQVYKFLYATRLLDWGLSSQAFHYCEVIGQAILRQREPCFVLTVEVIKLSDRLRHSEGQFSEGGVSGAEQEPDWLKQLRARHLNVQTGGYDCTETYQSTHDAHLAHDDNQVGLEPILDNLSRDVQSPEPNFLYYRGPEEQETIPHQLAGDPGGQTWDSSEAQDRPDTAYPVPVTVVYASPEHTVAVSQDFSYHNTDSAGVSSVPPHCPPSALSSAAEGAVLSSEAVTMGGRMMQSQHSQQSSLQGAEAQEQTAQPPKQNTKSGWFSGWFTSKPKDASKESLVQESQAQTSTEQPSTSGFSVPPSSAKVSPPTFPSPSSLSVGINPYSRKAGQQLG